MASSTSCSTRARPYFPRSRRASGARTAFNIVSCSLDDIVPSTHALHSVLEHGSKKHRDMALDHLLAGLLEYATNEQGVKSVTKALKEGGKEVLDRIIKRMCEPAKG